VRALDLAEVARFRAIIADRLGLYFEDARIGFLGDVLAGRLAQTNQPPSLYLSGLEETPAADDEMRFLVQELTVGETYFFRNREQFQALADIALPNRIAARAAGRKLRILSAGCSSGEEPYSIAITVHETVVDPTVKVMIHAVDINSAALLKARRARYSAWSLRETPQEIQHKWFAADGRKIALDDRVRSAVVFDRRNLAIDDQDLWAPETYDIIFCRNVLMYFSPDHAAALVARIAGALMPDGYLFLGYAETLRGLSDRFDLCHTHGTFYYRRKNGMPKSEIARGSQLARAPGGRDESWFEVIRTASARVEALTTTAESPSNRNRGGAVRWNTAATVDLLRHERFAEALASVHERPPDSEHDPDTLLLEATLLVHSGKLAPAENVCRRLLEIDSFNAGAHYVLALCREKAADHVAATEHDRTAVHLDPAFAMPRLHLGLLARQTGDRDRARRELSHALLLLKSEHTTRILLFGGGFSREALIALCGSALRDCGGKP
jgi:chemotaxis protein methyltransferase CheR